MTTAIPAPLSTIVVIGTTASGSVWRAYPDRHTLADVAIMADRIGRFGGSVSAEAAELLRPREVVRVRKLTPAQASWLRDLSDVGFVFRLSATGTTWIEGERAELGKAVAEAFAADEGMWGNQIAATADENAASLPEHLRESFIVRQINSTLTCIATAANKVMAALEGRDPNSNTKHHESQPAMNAERLLSRLA